MSNSVDRFFGSREPEAERRVANRVEIEQLVEVSYDREVFMQASAIDLSQGGLRVLASQKLEPGTLVFAMLRLGLPGGEEVSVSANCVAIHCFASGHQWTVGLRFHEISPHDQALVDRVVGGAA